MKFIVDQFKKIISLLIALTVIATFLFALSLPLTLIDNYFGSNSTYKKIKTSLSNFSTELLKTTGCAIDPGLCIPLEELSIKLRQENFIFDKASMEQNPRCENLLS